MSSFPLQSKKVRDVRYYAKALGIHLFYYDKEGNPQYKRKQSLIEEIERKVRNNGSSLYRDWIDRIERRQPIWRNIANLSKDTRLGIYRI